MPDIESNSLIFKCVMHPCRRKLKQLESVSFQSSDSASHLSQIFLIPVVRRVTSECKEDTFSNRIPLVKEGRTYIYFVNNYRVMPDIESNNLLIKSVMHPCRIAVKQLESASFQSSDSALYLSQGHSGISSKFVEEKNEEELLIQEGLGKVVQPQLREVNCYNNAKILEKVRSMRKYISAPFVFRDLSKNKDSTFIFDTTRSILFLIPNTKIHFWLKEKYVNYSAKVVSKQPLKCFILKPKMLSEGLLDPIYNLFSKIQGSTQFIIKVAKNYDNPHVTSWVMDVLTLTLELNDPFFWRPVSMLKFIARLYSAVLRFSDFKNNQESPFFSQSLEEPTSIDSVMLVLTCFGLPDKIMTSLRQISLLTNKKILDTPNIFIDLMGKFLEVCYDLLLWIKDTLNLSIVDSIINMIVYPLNFVKGLKLTREMSLFTSQFQKDNQIIFDSIFREKVKTLHSSIQSNGYIQSLLVNSNYKVYLQQYNILDVMNKLCSNFETSSRREPVCIVFEGKAGCGKSTLMNKLVEYLTKQSYSVYAHSCPSVDAGKDFYDDYLNQDVFVMDDVGQQGVSQWRQIINFVSPVKFPLECASANLKNTKYFDSKLLLITTNHFSDLQGFTKADCIAEPEALFRRCHVVNFDDVRFVNGVMQGEIKYKKYDHIRHEWVENFIAPMENFPVASKINSANMNRAIAWLYAVTTGCLEVQERLYSNNKLSEKDEESIDEYVKSFIKKEEVFHDATDDPTMTSQANLQFLSFIDGYNADVFKEYFSFFKEFCVSSTSILADLLKKYVTQDSIASFTSKVLEGVSITFITLAASKIYDCYIGNVAMDNFTQDVFRQQSVQAWQEAHSGYINKTLPSAMYNPSNSDVLNDIISSEADCGTRIQGIRGKMRVVEMISDDGYKNVAQAVVSGRRMLVQTHSYSTHKGIANVFSNWSCYSNSSYECNNIPFKVLKEWKEYDLAIIEIQLTVPVYKDVTVNLFSKDLMNDTPSNIRKIFFVNSEAAISLDNNFVVNRDSFQVQTPVKGKTYTVLPGAGIRYPVSAAGLCGSLIVDAEFGLCGVHVAGNSENGFAFVLPKRTLQEMKILLSNAGNNQFTIKENDDVNYSGMKIFNDLFLPKNTLRKTKLARSEMHDELVAEVKDLGEKLPPNFLSFGSKTIAEIAKKSLKPIPAISSGAIEFGKKCISQFLAEFDDLSDYEVIKGMRDLDLSSLNKNSVNGYGYGKDKADFIDFESGTITAKFETRIEEFIKECETDSVSVGNILFYEAFKDELRVEEKINKPRTFRVAPLHHTFLVKKFCGKLFSHCRSNMWDNQMAIGINPYTDWDKLYKRLKKCYINFDGDFGNWDGGAPAQVQDAISELVLQFYKGPNTATLRVLLDSMVRSFVLIKEKLVLTTHSMPSGCWVTAFFNSLINRFLTAMVLYTEKTKRNEIPTIDDFNKLTDFVFGDDKICGAPHELKEYFNAFTMKSLAESIGMRYTDGEKGEITNESKPLSECVFLKRNFKWHTRLEKVVGPLSKATLVNSLRYTDSTRNYDEIMDGKMTAFQFEIYLHEDEPFKQQILSAAKSKSFYFKEFSDEHIARTMQHKDTYLQIMKAAGKDISNYT